MKKLGILILGVIAISAFGFVSSETNNNGGLDKNNLNNLTILKGAEKSGLTQSNQNW